MASRVTLEGRPIAGVTNSGGRANIIMFSDRLNRHSIYESKRNLKFDFIISFATRSAMSFNIVSALRPFSNIYSFASKSGLIHTGFSPVLKRTGESENRFNGFSCGSACNSLYSINVTLLTASSNR